MAKARIETEIVISPDEYYEKVYANAIYQETLAERVGLKERRILNEEDRGAEFSREVYQVPARDLPGPIKKITGGKPLNFTDTSTYYKSENRLEFKVLPSIKPDKISIQGKLWLESSPKGAKRICEMEVVVGIFAVGKIIEKLILTDVEKGQRTASDLINELYGKAT